MNFNTTRWSCHRWRHAVNSAKHFLGKVFLITYVFILDSDSGVLDGIVTTITIVIVIVITIIITNIIISKMSPQRTVIVSEV